MPAEQLVLCADFIALNRIRIVGGGESAPAQQFGQRRCCPPHAVAFGICCIEQITGIGLIGNVDLGGYRVFVLAAAGSHRNTAIVIDVGWSVGVGRIVEMGDRNPQSGIKFQLIGDFVTDIGKDRTLFIAGGNLAGVVEIARQQVLTPGILHGFTPQILGERGQLRIDIIVVVELCVAAIERADQPAEPGRLIHGFQPDFLGEILLRVAGQPERGIAAECTQAGSRGRKQQSGHTAVARITLRIRSARSEMLKIRQIV